jgi:hypothetical protein
MLLPLTPVRLERHACRLRRFDRFLQQRAGAAKESLATLAREYSALAPSAAGRLERITVGRLVAAALNRSGVPASQPKADRLLKQRVLREERRPYIYTEAGRWPLPRILMLLCSGTPKGLTTTSRPARYSLSLFAAPA